MKTKRVFVCIFIILFIFSLSGCGKTWFMSFTNGTSIADWHIDDWGGSYIHDNLGLRIDYLGFISPFAFTGDFTLTVVFTLDTAPDRTVDFEIGLYDDISVPLSNNIINNHFNNAGNIAFEYIGVSELGPSIDPDWNYTITQSAEIPGLNRSGRNTYKLVKKGDDISITINNTAIANFTMGYYESSNFAILLGADASNDGVVFFETIKVNYSGDLIPI